MSKSQPGADWSRLVSTGPPPRLEEALYEPDGFGSGSTSEE